MANTAYWEGPYIQSYAPGSLSTPKEVTDNGRTVNKIYAVSAEGDFGAGEFKGGSATVPVEQRDNYPLVEMGDIVVAYTLNRLDTTEQFRKAIITQFICIDVALGELEDGTGTVTYSGPGISKELIRKVLRSPIISLKYNGTTTSYTENYVFLDAAHAEASDFYNGGVIEINGALADIWNYSGAENRAYVNNWRGEPVEDGTDPLAYIIHHGNATDNLDQAVSYSQTQWVNSLNGGAVSGTPGGSFHVVDGRNCLEMVNVIAEETGYQYRNLLADPPVRQLDWFDPQGTPISSGVYLGAKSEFTETALYADPTKGVIISCHRRTSRRDKWTRMIVSSGDGLTLNGLTLSDITVPTGFSVDFAQSMVTNTAAEVGLSTPEIFEKTQIFKDVTSPSATPEAQKATKIRLFNATITAMHYKAGQFHTYDARTVLLRDLAIGQRLYLKYVHTVAGEVVFSVDRDVWIRNMKLSASADDGVRYIDLELGEQYEADISDGPRATAKAIKDGRGTTTGQIFFGTPAVSGGVTDHGQLQGLTDVEDHPGYLLTDGSRQITGNQSVAAGITIDGVDISAHALDADAHHDEATAGDHISLTGQQINVIATDDGDNTPLTVLKTDADGGLRLAELGMGVNPSLDGILFGTNYDMKGSGFVAASSGGFTEQWYLETANAAGESTLHVSNLIADSFIVQTLQAEVITAVGNKMIITKNVGILAEDFTVPAVSSSGTIVVKDNPAVSGAGIFSDDDKIVFRVFERDSGFAAFWVGGYVDTYSDNADGTQDWTFHCEEAGLLDGAVGLIVKQGTPIIDYGRPHQVWIEIDASEETGANIRMGSWAGANPWDAANRKQNLVMGNMFHTTGEDEIGFLAGHHGTDGPHVIVSDKTNRFVDVPIEMRTGVTDYGYFRIFALELKSDVESHIYPNGDLASTANMNHGGTGTGDYYTSIDSDPLVGQPDGDWLYNTQGGSAVAWFEMGDISHTLTELEIRVRMSVHDFSDDSLTLRAQMMKNDGVTPLSDLVFVGSEASYANGAGGFLKVQFTGLDTTATDAAWAGAYLRLDFDYVIAGTTTIITIDPDIGINIDAYSALSVPSDTQFVLADYSSPQSLVFGSLSAPQGAIYSGANLATLRQPFRVRALPDDTWDYSTLHLEAVTAVDEEYARLIVVGDGGGSLSFMADDATIMALNDSAGLRLRSSGVLHSEGGLSNSTTYGAGIKISASDGGMRWTGYTDADRAVQLLGYAATGDTAVNTGADGTIVLSAYVNDTTPAAGVNIVTMKAGLLARWMLQGDGDTYQDGDMYDAQDFTPDFLDDVHAVRSLMRLSGDAILSRFDTKKPVYSRKELHEHKLVDGRHKNRSRQIALNSGAVWQTYTELLQLRDDLEHRLSLLEAKI